MRLEKFFNASGGFKVLEDVLGWGAFRLVIETVVAEVCH